MEVKIPMFLEGMSFSLPLQSFITDNKQQQGQDLQVVDVMAVGWFYMILMLSVLSAFRVARHLKFSVKHTASAYSKLLSPGMLCVSALFVCSKESIRFESLCLGLCLCLITIKMIVFGMAHMAYASLQGDVLPFMAVCVLDKYIMGGWNQGYPLLALWSLFRLLRWVQLALQQLCERLDIFVFRIKRKE
jgi:hypothetical protein